ncbi:MAG: DUF58 domain-containing protein [Clostridia bacterium]|nr:DUF58 domain-containing protein [Clostridia bacterium]
MAFIDFLSKAAQSIIEAIARFVMSPAFPYFFWLAVAVVIFLILRKIYLRIRENNLCNITYTREFTEKGVYAGDEVELIETVVNNGFFPLLAVDIEAYLYNELRLQGFEPPKKDGMQYFISRFNLWPYMRIRRRHKLVCLKRGHYQLQSAVVRKKLGEEVFECPAEIYVYPKPFEIDPALPAVSMMQGDERALRQLFADPFSISGVRDYRFGDPVSQINFKASAKTWLGSRRSATPLMVNDRDFCAARRLAVFIDYHLERDCGIDGEEYGRLTELALSYSAHIIRNAVYGGYSVGFFANCKRQDGSMIERFPLAGGEAHMLDIFRTMASMRAADGGSFPALLDELLETGENSAEILIFVLCQTPETDARAFELERRGNGVRVFSLPELFFSEEAANE